MLQLIGRCYEVRDQLKKLGCWYDSNVKQWFAPDDTAKDAQAIVDAAYTPDQRWADWIDYLATLAWIDGAFTETVWVASLRACSLRIPYEQAWHEIATRVRGVKKVGDGWFDRNIRRAYAAAGTPEAAMWRPDSKAAEKKEKPEFRTETIQRVAGSLSRECHIGWFAARSPIDPFTVTAEGFLAALYEPGERVVIFDKFESQGQWVWGWDEGFEESFVSSAALYERALMPPESTGYEFSGRGPKGIWYLCNPVHGGWEWMDEVTGDDEPHWSRRFWKCIKSWRYIVFESDKASAWDWLAMAAQLPMRIAAIYTSGGKSVHVLVRFDAKSKEQWDGWRDEVKDFMHNAGADKGCMSAVRLTRLPVCFREEKSQPQKLLYLNPTPDMTPICAKPIVRDAVGPWIRLAESIHATDGSELDVSLVVACRRALDFYAAAPGVAALRKGALR